LLVQLAVDRGDELLGRIAAILSRRSTDLVQALP